MPSVEVSAGSIEYADTGGDGRIIVLLHGLAMDGTVWRDVVDELDDGWRYIMPTLPFGAHRVAMRADADLSLRGMGRMVAEQLERLDLRDVTLCFNDWGRSPGDDRRGPRRPGRTARSDLVRGV